MHDRTLLTRLRVPSYALAASLCARTVLAQNAPPPNAPPTQAPPIAAPSDAPPMLAPPSQGTDGVPPITAQGVPSTPPPSQPPSAAGPPGQFPPPPNQSEPNAPPPYPPPGYPPAQYGRLGGPPPEVENGTWDPWAHPIPGRFEHEGFFLRLHLGPSFATVSRPDYRWSGVGLAMGLSIGGSLVENFALHVDFQSTLLPSPTQHAFGHNSDLNADIVFESMGLGATYYIMPVNVYISGSVGIGVLVFEGDDGQSKDTSAGLTLAGTVGKEWWLGSDWGLGVAAQVLFMRVNDYVDDAHMNALAFNLLFSATYN